MFPVKRIVVATDFSETSDRAVDAAVELAATTGASVTVVHAYEIPVYGFPDGSLVASADFATRITTAAQEALAATLEMRKSKGVELEPELRQGVPWQEVNDVADKRNADLIVIGTHGRSGLAHALLGSVAERVIRSATRPVLVIRDPRKK